ncbi:helix-turn-helix transcriptional regulator [Curtobacterium sp. RHCJP20]|uniref:Helix-turn-helix transcriptional regulator n=1 Tax=Curtobacterium subtropicum TaxID=3055138 RepID=A0ABT7TEH4_9MICO|nr:helix-turn-helix transcriptional regulator [Curtobacterium subtropicum]MDM7887973.1 helix-turn-helix transcriptional regulator [Curtobacterium subtropicum]
MIENDTATALSATLTRTRLVTRTREPATARSAIQHTSTVRGLEVTGSSDFLFEETLTGTSLLTLESTSCTGTVPGEVDASSAIVVTWLKSGTAVVGGQQLPIGRPVLYTPGRQHVQWDRFQKDVMRIDREIVEQVAAARGGWEPGPLEFQPNHVPEGAPLAAWWLMVRAVAAEILGATGEVSLDREQELAGMAAAGLLTAIPHWPVEQPAERTAHAGLADAETYLLEHVAEHVTVDDVAAAARMSTRGLQSAFQRIHGTTPMSYLRNVRLLMARQQLETGEPRSVADVARSVGITHMGRFSGAYREEFGELPAETLRAARR